MPNEENDLQLKKELLLWKLNHLDAGNKKNFQQLWRARFLLATMSAAFLGICVTGNFNSGRPISVLFYFLFAFVFILLFYSYDCHMNYGMKSSEEKARRVQKALWGLPKNCDQLKQTFFPESKSDSGFDMNRFLYKLRLGLKELERILFYLIIILLWVAGFFILNSGEDKMDWITLIENNFAAFIGVLGVLFGFILTAGWEAWKEHRKRKQMVSQIPAELKANLHMIEQKRDTLTQIINHLKNRKVLTGIGVGFITTFYDTHIHQLYPYYSAKERNSLHLIYQSLKTINLIMHTFEQELIQHLALKLIDDPYDHYVTRMTELLNAMNRTEKLIGRHLDGDPVDVLYIEERTPTN